MFYSASYQLWHRERRWKKNGDKQGGKNIIDRIAKFVELIWSYSYERAFYD